MFEVDQYAEGVEEGALQEEEELDWGEGRMTDQTR